MLDEVTEPVSPAAEVELALASAMLEDMLEAMLEPEDMADEAEEAALSEAEDMEDDISIMELLLLSGAAVELAEPSQVAAVGRFVTPCPEQREFANSRVSEEALVWCDLSSFLCYSSCLIFFLWWWSLLFWSSSLQAVLTQQERPESRVVELQMHFTSREPQSPKLVPTQVAAQEGRPGIWAAARLDSRATAVRVKACIFASKNYFM